MSIISNFLAWLLVRNSNLTLKSLSLKIDKADPSLWPLLKGVGSGNRTWFDVTAEESCFSGQVEIGGEVGIGMRPSTAAKLQVGGPLKVTGDVTHDQNLNVGGGLNVTGASDLNGGLNVTGDASVSQNISGAGNLSVSGDSSVTGSQSLGADLNVMGDAVIHGNLNVKGTTTTINTAEMEVTDNIIRVNKYAPQANPEMINSGLEVFRGGTAPEAQILWDESSQKWMAGKAGALSEIFTGSSGGTVNLQEQQGPLGAVPGAGEIYTRAYALQSLYLNGNDDYLDLSEHIPSLGRLNQGAISIWYKPEPQHIYSQALFSYGALGTSTMQLAQIGVGPWTSGLGDESLIFSVTGGSDYLRFWYRNKEQYFAKKRWHHILVNSGGTEGTALYVDGVRQNVQFGYGSPTTQKAFLNKIQGANKLTFGKRFYGSHRNSAVNGHLSQLAMWDRPLSSEEIRRVYQLNRYHDLTQFVPGGLVGYWCGPMDDQLPVMKDYSGNNHHGRANGMELRKESGMGLFFMDNTGKEFLLNNAEL